MSTVSDPLLRLERLGTGSIHVTTRRMLIVANPHATTLTPSMRSLITYALQGRYEVDAVDTERQGHAIELAREAAAEGYDVIVALGGDGTVNEVANGLVGSATPMAILPGGSANVLARMLGIPGDLVDATEDLLQRADRFTTRTIDLGRVGERWFTFSAGVGIDAAVVGQVDARPRLKAKLGPLFYAQAAVAEFARTTVRRPSRLRLELEGETIEGVSAFVQNGRPYTYARQRPVELAEDVALDSGTLSGVVLRRANPIDLPSIAVRALLPAPRMVDHRQVASFTGASTFTISSEDGHALPVQVDGDNVGSWPSVEFSVRAGALRVVA